MYLGLEETRVLSFFIHNCSFVVVNAFLGVADSRSSGGGTVAVESECCCDYDGLPWMSSVLMKLVIEFRSVAESTARIQSNLNFIYFR